MIQSGGDVDAVAEQVAVALDHIANRDADPKAHLAAWRISHVAGTQAFLDVDRATHRFHCAWKFGQNGIAGGVENTPSRPRDEIVGDGAVGGKPPQRLLLVLGDQSRIAGNIGRKNRRDLAFHESEPRTIMRQQNAD
jgi:hypothetical protein